LHPRPWIKPANLHQSGGRAEGGKGVAKGKMKGKKVEEKREDCGECNMENKSQEQGVTCDLFFHDKCCNISAAQYLCLTQESKEKQDHLEGELLEVRNGVKDNE